MKTKLFFILFFFFQSLSSASNLEDITFNLVKPLEKQNCYESKKLNSDKIFIELKNPKSWIINYVRAIEDGKKMRKMYQNEGFYLHYDPLLNKYKKKWFKVSIKYQFQSGRTCMGNGKIKLTGDFLDHFEGTNGQASFRLSLQDFSIYNNTKFKIFYPPARNIYNEIYIHEFINIFEILSPETRGVVTKFSNFFEKPMILQEEINKEFVEKNYSREGPLVEGNEFLKLDFSRKNLNILDKRLPYDIRYSLPKIKNSKWSIRNDNNLSQSLFALNKIQNVFFENIKNHLKQDITRSAYYIFENPKYFQQENTQKLTMMNCLQEIIYFPHFSVLNNKIFYYNTLQEEFEPILYDTNFDLKKSISLNHNNIEICTKGDLDKILNTIDKFNSDEFLKNLNKKGIQLFISEMKIRVLTDKLKSIIKSKVIQKFKNAKQHEYEMFEKINISDLFKKYGSYNIDKYIALSEGNDKFLICNPIMSECKANEFKIEDIQKLLEGKLMFDEKFIQLITNFDNKTSNRVKLDFIELRGKFDKYLVNDENKEIILETKNPFSQVIIKNKSLEGWKINYTYIKNNENFSENRISNFIGCINILQSQVKNLNINVENCKLEDSVNIINSKGDINSLFIKNAESDGIDFDFSKIQIRNLKVNSAKNDCLDMSFGEYIINKYSLSDCGDKAVSSGEKSRVNLINGSINKAYFGIVSKDESVVNLGQVEIENTKFCLAQYRKKQEFDIGLLEIKNKNSVKCNNQNYLWSYE